MILKEAFRNQNFLASLVSLGLNYLQNTDNVVQKKEMHLRSKTNKEAPDEEIIATKPTLFENKNINANTVIDFIMDVLNEKEKLTEAIAEGKAKERLLTDFDMDSAVALNKTKQNVAMRFGVMSNIKGNEVVRRGTGYKFNADGDQVSYFYDVKEVTTIDFNRNKVKALVKMLNKECDEISAKLDLANVTIKVDYVPKYEVGDTLEDCIDKFLE